MAKNMGIDGKLWSEEFYKRFPQSQVDDVLGWFCNTIIAGYNEGKKTWIKEVDEAEQRGMQRIIDWLNEKNALKLKSLQGTPDWYKHCGLLIPDETWQAFLKSLENGG